MAIRNIHLETDSHGCYAASERQEILNLMTLPIYAGAFLLYVLYATFVFNISYHYKQLFNIFFHFQTFL